MKKDIHANTKHRKVIVALLISENKYFRATMLPRVKVIVSYFQRDPVICRT
jgi:hypothetical protein